MAKSTSMSSASLHLRMRDFGVLFSVLAVTFTPYVAFSLALAASIMLSKL